MNAVLSGTLLVVALIVVLWGLERYRTRFERTELLVSLGIAGGLVVLVVTPEVFGTIGNFLNINQRYLVISLMANLVFIGFLLYLFSLIQSIRVDISEMTRSLSVDQVPETDGGSESIYIVIPAYNEEKTIRSVVEDLPARLHGYDVQPLVISDGSQDNTASNAKYNGTAVVEHPVNQGQGGALKTGFEIALKDDAAIVVTMDGDGQHPADELDHLVAPIMNDEADFVMGSRHRGEDNSGNGFVRRAGIVTFTGLINVLTKSDITDCTNGYRAIRGTELEKLELTEERFSAPELIIEARKNGLRLQEIPIMIKKREAGETKKPQLRYAVGLTRTILTTWIR